MAVASMAHKSESNNPYGSMRSMKEFQENEADDESHSIKKKLLKPINQTRNFQENSFERIISAEQTERRET
jgi:hypothetical protein